MKPSRLSPAAPRCRHCQSARATLVVGAPGEPRGPRCANVRACERRRIAKAIAEVLASVEVAIAQARSNRARAELNAYRSGLRVGFSAATGARR